MGHTRRRPAATVLAVLAATTGLPAYLLLGGPAPAAASPAVSLTDAAAGEVGVTCAMLPAGIRAQESGGNRSAISTMGAVGPDQIMPSNVGPWTREATGRAATVAEFRASPALQDRTARYKLGQLCRAHGVRGAAAAWYSGRPERHRDYRPLPNRSGPSVGAYVDSVMALARRGGG